MADPKYGTKAERLRHAATAISQGAPSGSQLLPIIRNQDEAEAAGRAVTPDQFILMAGALLAVRRMYEAARLGSRHGQADEKAFNQQLSADLAFQGQML